MWVFVVPIYTLIAFVSTVAADGNITYCDNNCFKPGYYCIENNPNAYVQCDKQGQRSIIYCIPGLLWDPAVNVCNYPSKISSRCICNQAVISSPPLATPSPFGFTGINDDCLACICKVSSGCNTTVGCNNGYCGPYQLSREFYDEFCDTSCGVVDKERDFEKCVNDKSCSEKCVWRYLSLHGYSCKSGYTPTCKAFQKVPFGGQSGCNSENAQSFWNQVSQCYAANHRNTASSSPVPSWNIEKRRLGDFDDDCLACICETESGCNEKIGCVGVYCGPYQISWSYYLDCDVDGGGYVSCATSKNCSEICIRRYMRRYAASCLGSQRLPTCEDFARIHRGGPNGCTKETTSSRKVATCYAKGNGSQSLANNSFFKILIICLQSLVLYSIKQRINKFPL